MFLVFGFQELAIEIIVPFIEVPVEVVYGGITKFTYCPGCIPVATVLLTVLLEVVPSEFWM